MNKLIVLLVRGVEIFGSIKIAVLSPRVLKDIFFGKKLREKAGKGKDDQPVERSGG